MRHLGSLLLSLFLTVAWYLVIGLSASYAATSDNGRTTKELILGAGLLVGAALFGLLLLLRLSPVGLVVTGLLLLVLGLWTLFATDRGPFEYLPTSLFGQRGAVSYPVQFAVFASVPMLMTVFSPRRWRRYPDAKPVAETVSVVSLPPRVQTTVPAGSGST